MYGVLSSNMKLDKKDFARFFTSVTNKNKLENIPDEELIEFLNDKTYSTLKVVIKPRM